MEFPLSQAQRIALDFYSADMNIQTHSDAKDYLLNIADVPFMAKAIKGDCIILLLIYTNGHGIVLRKDYATGIIEDIDLTHKEAVELVVDSGSSFSFINNGIKEPNKAYHEWLGSVHTFTNTI